MKNYIFRTATLIGLFALTLQIPLSASTVFRSSETYDKKISKQYNVNADVKVDLSNKYGKIHVNTWDKNEVNIEVIIKVDARNKEAADKILENINIEVQGNNSIVSVKTIFKNKWKNKNCELSIDYKVSVPRNAAMDLTNKFGDIYTGDLQGPSQVALQYGNLRMGDLNNKTNKIDLQFSEGEIKFIAMAEVSLQYSEIEIDKAGALQINSQFSELDIGPAGELDIDAQYDEIEIEGAAKLRLDIQFGDLEVALISKELHIVASYSDLIINSIPATFEKVYVDDQYSDIKLNIAENASYILDAHGSFSDMDLPDNFNIGEKKEGTTSWRYFGTVGNDPGTRTVTIETSYGDVELD